MRSSLLLTAFVPSIFTGLSFGQSALPLSFVTDTAGDTIWLMEDLDEDGTYNGAGEAKAFYDDTIGSIALTNNAGLIRSGDGALWVSDTSEDIVLRLFDSNGDGDAHDAGEAVVWFDGTAGNPSGVELTSGRGMWRDADGVHWVASANSGGGGVDAIVRLEDLNGDGDANDAGEQLNYFAPSPGGSVGDSIPTAVARGLDGALYYVETGSTGVLQKGVWRLEDLDMSGTIDQPAEATLFFVPTVGGSNPFHWDLALDDSGNFYLNDTGNDVVWRFADADGSGVVDPISEADAVYTATGSSLIWETAPFGDGALYITEDQNPDRLLRAEDLDGDGVFNSAGEVIEIYSEALAAVNFGSPKAVIPFETFEQEIGIAECSPGVVNSSGTSSTLRAFGSTSIASNSIRLDVSGLPLSSFGFFVTSQTGDIVVGAGGSQGTLCLGGAIGRFVGGTIFNTGMTGAAETLVDLNAIPQPMGSVVGAVGETWRFQCWHRDANPGVTSNFSDAVAITLTN